MLGMICSFSLQKDIAVSAVFLKDSDTVIIGNLAVKGRTLIEPDRRSEQSL